MKDFLQLLRGFGCCAVAVLFFAWIIGRVRALDARLSIQMPAWTEMPGLLMMVLGGTLLLLCIAVFGLWGRGTPSLLNPTKELVTLGPYRYVRNPIHIGQVVFFAGLALYLRSVAVLLFSVAWLLFCHFYVVLVEEKGLTRKFGTAYDEYRKVVPRWIPLASFHKKVG